jgi:hypothetical protein
MCQRVVEYDILIGCQKLPDLVQGIALDEVRLTPAELDCMRDLLMYLKENSSTPEIYQFGVHGDRQRQASQAPAPLHLEVLGLGAEVDDRT